MYTCAALCLRCVTDDPRTIIVLSVHTHIHVHTRLLVRSEVVTVRCPALYCHLLSYAEALQFPILPQQYPPTPDKRVTRESAECTCVSVRAQLQVYT